MSTKSAKRNILLFCAGIVLAAGYGYHRWTQNLEPISRGEAQLIRYDKRSPLSVVLRDLEERHIIRNAAALGLFSRFNHGPAAVESGTYSLAPGMTAGEILKAVKRPVTVNVTVPEYFWVARTAALMEKHNVAKAADFIDMAQKPSDFAKDVKFPLPARSLEGYLFPDTYRMAPMSGAKPAIQQQLENFQKKVWEGLGEPKNLSKAIIVASLVEREAKLDNERPLVAGVIENRLAKGMPLEIDATVLYAQQRWHIPTRQDIRHTISPYNTYMNKGLPPGPICSPGLKSIKAALNPAKTKYFYYVAMPDGHSLFAATYPEHLANVNKRRHAMRAAH